MSKQDCEAFLTRVNAYLKITEAEFNYHQSAPFWPAIGTSYCCHGRPVVGKVILQHFVHGKTAVETVFIDGDIGLGFVHHSQAFCRVVDYVVHRPVLSARDVPTDP